MSDIDLVAVLRGAVEAAQQRAESEQGNGREKGSISVPDPTPGESHEVPIRTPLDRDKLRRITEQRGSDGLDGCVSLRASDLLALLDALGQVGAIALDDCNECGDGVQWPCPTILALDGGDNHA